MIENMNYEIKIKWKKNIDIIYIYNLIFKNLIINLFFGWVNKYKYI